MIKKILLYKIKRLPLLIFFIFLFGVGLLAGKMSAVYQESYYEKINMNPFWEALDLIEKKYIYSDSIDYERIVNGAISGMVDSLDDYPTTFFTTEEVKLFLEDTKGNFEGVGMEIGLRNGQLQIITPLEGTPAEKAGLRAGDNILKIDEIITSDISIEEAVSLIRGKKGTKVILTIIRSGLEKPKEISIIRDTIEIPSMRLEFLENNNSVIAHIKLIHFSSKSSSDFSQIGKEILNSNAKGIILDIRNNPGGYLTEAKEIANWFLREGDIITIQEGKEEKIEYKAKNNGHLSLYPIVIIINEGSASASEILASAIKENYNVIVVGEKSFGKGSVQELVKLKNGAGIKITVAKWLTPQGNLIDGIGITPDIVIEMSEDDYENEEDKQLEKAIEILKDII